MSIQECKHRDPDGSWSTWVFDGCPRCQIEHLREALKKIADGDGYYGAQAAEYKGIARRALLDL